MERIWLRQRWGGMRNSMSYSLTHTHIHTRRAAESGYFTRYAARITCCARFIIENRKPYNISPPLRQPAVKISHICAFFRTSPAAKITSAPHLIDGHKQDQEPKEKKCYPGGDCVTPPKFFMHLVIVARNVSRRVAKYLHKCAQARRARVSSILPLRQHALQIRHNSNLVHYYKLKRYERSYYLIFIVFVPLTIIIKVLAVHVLCSMLH